MSRKAKKYFAVFVAAVLCVSLVTFSAFAVGQGVGRAERENDSSGTQTVPDTASTPSNSGKEKDTANTTADDGTGKVGHESTKGSVLLSIDLAGGTGLDHSFYATKGSRLSEFKTPVRSGYRFAGWKVNGTPEPDSYALNSDAAMTATWKKAAAASDSEDGGVTTQDSWDSDAHSQQDWSPLFLSSSSSDDQEIGTVSSEPGQTAPISRSSPLLYIGIALIALGAAGIGIFLYLRHSGKKPGGKGGPEQPGGGPDDQGDTMEFTDISSYSDGKHHDDASAILRDAQREAKSTVHSQRTVQKDRAPVTDASSQTPKVKNSFNRETFFGEK